MKKLSIFLITAFFAGMSAAQMKTAAVAETEIDVQAGAPADSTPAEAGLLNNDTASAADSRPFQRAYTLTVNASPPNGGVVTRSPDKETYQAGDTVIVTAAAESGYTFTGWTGAVSSRKDTLTVMMNSDKALTAAFYKRLYVEPKPAPQEKPHAKIDADDGDGRLYKAPTESYARPMLSDFSNAYVLPGAYISYNIREGYRKFDGVDGYQHVENTNPFIFGLMVGKRISIDSPRLRFQAAVELGRGSVKDLEYDADLRDGTGHVWSERVSLHSVYWTGGLLGDAHLLFPVDERTYFISAGLGAHLSYFDIAVKTVAGGQDISGVSGGMRGAVSPSVNLGGGVEYKLEGKGAACISFNLRFWQSASYKEAGELFPMGVNYTEFFFSQSIQLQYLLPPWSND